MRAVVAASRKKLIEGGKAEVLADAYVAAGVGEIELRISPVGSTDDSAQKVSSVLHICDVFRARFPRVILGYQGLIGGTALALGLVDGFSVGIGMREQYNFTRLRTRTEPRVEEEPAYGPQAGVYLPGAAVTVVKRTAQHLYQDRGIRSRLRCRTGCCAQSLDGPVLDPRGHYLASRCEELRLLLASPLPWRPTLVQRRLEHAALTVDMINDGHLPVGARPLSTRAVTALVAEIDRRTEAEAA